MGNPFLLQKRGTGQRQGRILKEGVGQTLAIEAACSLLRALEDLNSPV